MYLTLKTNIYTRTFMSSSVIIFKLLTASGNSKVK